jgi:insulysin
VHHLDIAHFSQLYVQVRAVHNEFKQNQQDDDEVAEATLYATARASHPIRKLGGGNQQSLWENPRRNGVDVRRRMHAHWRQHYHAQNMTVVVKGRESLDTLKEWVLEQFQHVRFPRRVHA